MVASVLDKARVPSSLQAAGPRYKGLSTAVIGFELLLVEK